MIRFFFLLLISATFLFGGKPAVFFLFKDAADIRILNKYEQEAGESFLPGTAFQVTEQNFLLSDGITPAWETILDDKTYFLVLSNDTPKLIHDCTVLQDTVQIIQDRLTIDLADGSRQILQKGQLLHRLFQKDSRTYVFAEEYGWCRLSRRAWKKIQRSDTPEEGFPERIQQRILGQIESINQNYRQFSDFFNTKFQKSKPTPQWLTLLEGKTYRIYLNHPHTAGHLKSSIAAIHKDFEQVLFGSGFKCQLSDNQFIISAVPIP